MLIAQTATPTSIIEPIQKEMQAESLKMKGPQLYEIEASVGVAPWDGNPDNFRDSLKIADTKMYEDKRESRAERA